MNHEASPVAPSRRNRGATSETSVPWVMLIYLLNLIRRF